MAPVSPVSDSIHAQKYRSEGETFDQAMKRIASALADDDDHESALLEILKEQRALLGGRIQLGAGAKKQVTLQNCYMSGTIEDSLVDGEGSIMQRATEAVATMRMGGGIGYDFSTLRPEGSPIISLGSVSSGPLSFMEIFNAACKTIASAGHRRGAQMAVMRVDHPDIRKFIRAKQSSTVLTQFNLSVAITDAFMEAVEEDTSFPLEFKGQIYEHVRARDLWNEIMHSTYDYAEPGVLFIDTMNNQNNLWWCEEIRATNPCGEQPLPPFGACLLGSFCLPKYVKADGFDWNQFEEDIHVIVRAMDNVIDISLYPLPQQREQQQQKRRMGIGVTGLSNAIEALLGRPSYGDDDFVELEHRILTVLRDECYRASIDLAKEKGAFPAYDDRYLESNFVRRLPLDIIKGIEKHGIRNSHLTSIAPTGTISMTADNVSSGCEPVFSYETARKVGDHIVVLKDYGVENFGLEGRRTQDVTIDQHLAVLGATVPYIDSAVSKTCNVPTDIPFEDFKGVYHRAWTMGCKGVTTFRLGGKREALLVSNDEPSGSCTINEDGSRSCEG